MSSRKKMERYDVTTGGGQILERQNVERPIFRNFIIANIKTTEDQSIVLFSN